MSCKLVLNEKTTQHFLVFKEIELILVDPHKSQLGCGVVHFIAFLQVRLNYKLYILILLLLVISTLMMTFYQLRPFILPPQQLL